MSSLPLAKSTLGLYTHYIQSRAATNPIKCPLIRKIGWIVRDALAMLAYALSRPFTCCFNCSGISDLFALKEYRVTIKGSLEEGQIKTTGFAKFSSFGLSITIAIAPKKKANQTLPTQETLSSKDIQTNRIESENPNRAKPNSPKAEPDSPSTHSDEEDEEATPLTQETLSTVNRVRTDRRESGNEPNSPQSEPGSPTTNSEKDVDPRDEHDDYEESSRPLDTLKPSPSENPNRAEPNFPKAEPDSPTTHSEEDVDPRDEHDDYEESSRPLGTLKSSPVDSNGENFQNQEEMEKTASEITLRGIQAPEPTSHPPKEELSVVEKALKEADEKINAHNYRGKGHGELASGMEEILKTIPKDNLEGRKQVAERCFTNFLNANQNNSISKGWGGIFDQGAWRSIDQARGKPPSTSEQEVDVHNDTYQGKIAEQEIMRKASEIDYKNIAFVQLGNEIFNVLEDISVMSTSPYCKDLRKRVNDFCFKKFLESHQGHKIKLALSSNNREGLLAAYDYGRGVSPGTTESEIQQHNASC